MEQVYGGRAGRELIRRARYERKMTQAGLARLMKCSRWTVRNWEIGKTSPTVGQLAEIARILRWPPLDVVVRDLNDHPGAGSTA